MHLVSIFKLKSIVAAFSLCSFCWDFDSDNNSNLVIGNVHQVAIVPPNYEGKPKKGHLIFNASFENGTTMIDDNQFVSDTNLICWYFKEIWVESTTLAIVNTIYSFDLTLVRLDFDAGSCLVSKTLKRIRFVFTWEFSIWFEFFFSFFI